MAFDKSSRAHICAVAFLLAFGSILSAAPRLSLSQDSSFVLFSVAPGSKRSYPNGECSEPRHRIAESERLFFRALAGSHHRDLGPVRNYRTRLVHPDPDRDPVLLAYGGNLYRHFTLSDPNAVDSPQNVVVVLSVGSPAPSQLQFYVAPGLHTITTLTATAQPPLQ